MKKHVDRLKVMFGIEEVRHAVAKWPTLASENGISQHTLLAE